MAYVRYCDGTGQKLPCPHPEDCTVSCMFNDATETRKVKPYPAVPEDVYVPDAHWQEFGVLMIVPMLFLVFVLFVLMFLAGFYFWGVVLV